jgi:phosphoglucosamine mutase
MRELFGTDGIRGIPGKYPLTKSLIKKIGYVAFDEIHSSKRGIKKTPLAIMGRDSRGSGKEIAAWLTQGINYLGGEVLDLGVVPTPVVSFLTSKLGADCGIVISASHNPSEFNGIKFFSSDGTKLSSDVEARIEARLKKEKVSIPSKIKSDLYVESPEAVRDYLDFIVGTLPKKVTLTGMKIVLDCANGAGYEIAPEIFERLGAKVVTIGCKPNGKNINKGCGSLEVEKMAKRVVAEKAHCGLSLDGDADRVIFVDETGAQFDGDDMLAMAAVELNKKGRLKNKKIVITVMSNYGLRKILKDNGISVKEVAVGDKNVTQAIDEYDLSLGGETSGHIIFRDFAPTGDGILSAVQILGLLRQSRKKLSHFRKGWFRYPHILKAVTVERKVPFADIPGFEENIKKLKAKLGKDGRILIRYSGTEPKLRVLVEGPDKKLISEITESIIQYYKEKCRGIV